MNPCRRMVSGIGIDETVGGMKRERNEEGDWRGNSPSAFSELDIHSCKVETIVSLGFPVLDRSFLRQRDKSEGFLFILLKIVFRNPSAKRGSFSLEMKRI